MLVLALLLGVYTSCTRIQGMQPAEAYAYPDFTPKQSQVQIPIEVSLKEIQTVANKYITGVLYNDNNLSDDGRMLKVWKHSAISVSMVGDELHYRVPIGFWFKGGFDETLFGVRLTSTTTSQGALALKYKTRLGMGPDWSIRLLTRPDGYEWIEKPTVSGLPADRLMGLVLEAAQDDAAATLDAEVLKAGNFKPYVQQAWDLMQAPIQVCDTPSTWFRMEPSTLAMVKPFGKNGVLYSGLHLSGTAITSLGAKPETGHRPLPPMLWATEGPGQFEVQLVTDLPYAELTQIARNQLVGQTYTMDEKGKKYIKITDVRVYPNRQFLVTEVSMVGKVSGTIYVQGIPAFDTLNKELFLDQLDFEIDSKNKLLKSANWLVHGVFLKKMSKALRYSYAEDLIEAEKQAEAYLNHYRPSTNVEINGNLFALKPTEVVLTPNAMKWIILAKGSLAVKLDQLDRF